MIELDDAKTLFSFDKDLEPVLKVPSGETVRIRTKDCFGNQLQGPEDQLSEIDWEAINQAFDENREGKRLRGGSTISQQTAKNVFCFPSRTWLRKGFEAYYTVLIECCWSKRRIMETYLNVIETGRNMYGVEAPAREVYGKSAKELNRYEASMIATVLPNPLRMRLQNPSNYMVRRAARVRTLMNMVGEVDLGR